MFLWMIKDVVQNLLKIRQYLLAAQKHGSNIRSFVYSYIGHIIAVDLLACFKIYSLIFWTSSSYYDSFSSIFSNSFYAKCTKLIPAADLKRGRACRPPPLGDGLTLSLTVLLIGDSITVRKSSEIHNLLKSCLVCWLTNVSRLTSEALLAASVTRFGLFSADWLSVGFCSLFKAWSFRQVGMRAQFHMLITCSTTVDDACLFGCLSEETKGRHWMLNEY